MRRNSPDIVAVLDLGTSKTCILVCEVREGLLRYAGHAITPSRGMKKSAVVDLDSASASIRHALATVEQTSGITVERAFLSCGGIHVKGMGTQAGIALASRSREISRDDTRRVLQQAQQVRMPEDREILHVLPQEYILDGQPGVRDPLGMLASRLEARVYLITAATGPKQNLVIAANRAGLEIVEMVFSPYASSEALLSAEERQNGTAVVEIGAGGTGVVAYVNGALCHAAFLGIGADHFTNDIAIAFATPPSEAEAIKRNFGMCEAARASAATSVEVPAAGGNGSRFVPQREICECIEARAREWIQLLHENLRRAGVLHALGSGIVLTGGGSRLSGLRALLADVAGFPVRIGANALIENMPEELSEPESAWSVGATFYAHRRMYALKPPHRPLWERLLETLRTE
jgi:cell division protein FtsA